MWTTPASWTLKVHALNFCEILPVPLLDGIRPFTSNNIATTGAT
jgi:hypothetical protein